MRSATGYVGTSYFCLCRRVRQLLCASFLFSSCDSTLKVFFFPHRIHRIDLIELLLAHGADLHAVDSSNQTAADVALFYNHEHVVKYLASRGGK
jgi:hypothetical protein